MHKIRTTLIGLTALTVACAAFAQQPIIIKFSRVVTADTPKGRWCRDAKRRFIA